MQTNNNSKKAPTLNLPRLGKGGREIDGGGEKRREREREGEREVERKGLE